MTIDHLILYPIGTTICTNKVEVTIRIYRW